MPKQNDDDHTIINKKSPNGGGGAQEESFPFSKKKISKWSPVHFLTSPVQ
jgi:hypothetical protein